MGAERFEEAMHLLEAAEDPMQILDEDKSRVIAIVGEENADSIPVFKYIVSSMSTPQNLHSRTKSLQQTPD